MNEIFWNLMIEEMSGAKFTNFGLNELAKSQVGPIKSSQQYMKLSESLYTPTSGERFDNL